MATMATMPQLLTQISPKHTSYTHPCTHVCTVLRWGLQCESDCDLLALCNMKQMLLPALQVSRDCLSPPANIANKSYSTHCINTNTLHHCCLSLSLSPSLSFLTIILNLLPVLTSCSLSLPLQSSYSVNTTATRLTSDTISTQDGLLFARIETNRTDVWISSLDPQHPQHLMDTLHMDSYPKI